MGALLGNLLGVVFGSVVVYELLAAAGPVGWVSAAVTLVLVGWAKSANRRPGTGAQPQ
jgi:hypothetical protein